jgi:ATP-dependent Zn protease
MSRKDTALTHTAYHEAGHIVMSHVVGLPCRIATIKRRGTSLGHVKHSNRCFSEIVESWCALGRRRSARSVAVAMIMVNMAGREAQVIAFGKPDCHDGDRSDLSAILELAFDYRIGCTVSDSGAVTIETGGTLRRYTAGILRRHWRKVEAVTKALLAHRDLKGSELEYFINQTLTDSERDHAKRVEAADARQRFRTLWHDLPDAARALFSGRQSDK